ncbi:hypothetical protein [Longimicrobium sp.]|jgi:hypothetical protein|uniref:hypothetical protein n=1 Tax=Longimicrobium sp. TaxID=2029185 RepID=UPI002F95A917
MRILVAASCAAFGAAVPAWGQAAAADPIAACAERLMPYADRASAPDDLPPLEISSATGHLSYFGASHSRDPEHPQFAAIRQLWEQRRPTVAFYEGPARPIAETGDETIRQYGESGYVRFLAQQAGARVERLEPPPQAEVAAMLERFPQDQVKLFYILRETARLRERQGLGEAELKAGVARMLQQANAMFGEQFGAAWTIDALDAAYRRYWTEPAAWWQAPTRWFDPLKSSAETGGIFTNDVNRASSEFRNRHMYTVLATAAARGERVFAVVGRDHVPAQAAALQCAITGAR